MKLLSNTVKNSVWHKLPTSQENKEIVSFCKECLQEIACSGVVWKTQLAAVVKKKA